MTSQDANSRLSQTKPRILLVGPMPPTKGGVTTFMLNLIASPLAQQYHFIPFTTSRPPKKNVTENWGYRAMLRGGVTRIVTGAFVTLWHLASFPFTLSVKHIRVVQIQASDYQVFWESALYALMARLLGRRVLFRIGGAFDIFHGQAGRFEQSLIARVLRVPDVVIAQSDFARDYIRTAGREGSIVLLPNWSRASPSPRLLRSDGEIVTCLFIAGLEARRKGVEEVLQAASLLKAEGCATVIRMVAVPPTLSRRIAASDVADMILIEGPLPHARILELMAESEIFLLPSHGEGFPNSLVEAMAAGMASVATPVGAVPEMAKDGGAIIVPVADGVALARAINQLVGSAGLRRQVSERAQITVQTHYVAEIALGALDATYARLLPSERG